MMRPGEAESGGRPAARRAACSTFGLLACALSVLAGCDGTHDESFEVTDDGLTVVRSREGRLEAFLDVREYDDVIGGVVLRTPRYNGLLPGPVLRLKPGDRLDVTLVNSLPPMPAMGALAAAGHGHGAVAAPCGCGDDCHCADGGSGADCGCTAPPSAKAVCSCGAACGCGKSEGTRAVGGSAGSCACGDRAVGCACGSPGAADVAAEPVCHCSESTVASVGAGHEMDLNDTNLHFHGLSVDPTGISDNIFRVAPAGGGALVYEVHIPPWHQGGVAWYHAHFHGTVARQVSGGLAGVIIVEGELDRVPEVAAAKERILVLQQLQLDATGQVPPMPIHGTVQDLVLVNGQFEPTITIAPGEVQRWRIVAANADRFWRLSLENHDFHQIALDGHPFAAPVLRSLLTIASGNRTEVLVQGGAPGTYLLKANAFFRGNGITDPEVTLARVVVEGTPVNGALPTTLVPPPPDAGTPAAIRSFSFDLVGTGVNGMPIYGINGQPFDINRIDVAPVFGTVEEWTIYDTMGEVHPFHLHTHPFQVVAQNGIPIANPVWQDTASVPRSGSITVRIPFTYFVGTAVMHCHILVHEDLGMMAVVDVVPPVP